MSRVVDHPLAVPRYACSPREVVRAGALWRLVQEAAVLDSTVCAWPPSRYRAEGTSFIVRALHGVHHRELSWGEPVVGRTWIEATQRDIIFDRRTDILVTHDTHCSPVLSTEVRWIFVSAGRPSRAPAALLDNFGSHAGPPLPRPEPGDAGHEPLAEWSMTPAFTDMDPLGHSNHPRYLDWADELISRWLHRAGVDPAGLIPRVDRVDYRVGAVATDTVTLTLTRVAALSAGGRFQIRFVRQDGVLLAQAELDREHTTVHLGTLTGPS